MDYLQMGIILMHRITIQERIHTVWFYTGVYTYIRMITIYVLHIGWKEYDS